MDKKIIKKEFKVKSPPKTRKLWKQELIKKGVWSEPDIKKRKCHFCGAELQRRAGACYLCYDCGEGEGCG